MEEYIVSARKYRPLNFDAVVGQRALTATLKNAIASGKLAHAYLFCGPRGVGKTTCARIFAKAINCLSPKDGGDACGQCESCVAFDQQRSMNIHELDAASNNSVEDIRELTKQVQIPPQIGKYKVFIIDEVHMLSASAFNAFLKTLEEPPSYVIFILATTEKHKILPTILSRCQVYDFQRMTTQLTVDHLMYVAQKEGYTAEPEALSLIAEKADGGMRDALSIFDQMVSFTGGNITYEQVAKNLNVLSTEYYFQLVDYFLAGNVQSSLLLLNDVLNKGFDGGNFINGLATHLRNLLVSQDDVTLPLLEMSDKMRAKYQEQAKKCKTKFLYQAIKLCNDCDQAYRTSRNKRLQVEICLIQASQLTEEDVPDAGRRPAKILKPIFTKPAAKSQTAASAPVVTTKPVATVTPQPQQPKPQVQAPTVSKPNIKEPKVILRKVSFKHFGNKATESQTEAKVQETQTEKVTVNKPLEDISLKEEWFAYVNQLPREQMAIAQRMRMLQPDITGPSSIEITVNSPQIINELNELKADMEKYLRPRLQNNELSMSFRLTEQETAQRSYSKQEYLQELEKMNPSLTSLIKELELEFD
ncbi:MAG: DNA polymerase III subunit gamma/tau [Bacteroidaceae bacterium]|nr:DNA polymerase III subunit gamma/tau [Bacteroidaceae bacterium]